MKIFSTSTIRDIDKYTIDNEPIASIDLMERAAMRLTNEIALRFDLSHRIYIFAGQGNNGGDALAVARLMVGKGYQVFIFLCNPFQKLSPDCAKNKERLLKIPGIQFTEIISEFPPPELTANDVVIDGLFGSGLSRPLSGGHAALVKHINASSATVVAIDIPSGLFDENNASTTCAIKATLTLTLQFPKLSFFFAENDKYVGELKIIDIHLHPAAIRNTPASIQMLEAQDVARLLHKRNRFSHKGTFGHGLLIAGSLGKMGAAILSSKAGLRTGIGLLTAHVPECGMSIMQTAIPEAMLSLDSYSNSIGEIPDLDAYSAIAVGPGIGTTTQTSTFLEEFLPLTGNIPVVLDADALNIIATWPVQAFPSNSIITPHPKEFDRLAGKSASDYDRFIKAQRFAARNHTYIILKGAYTAIICPDNECFFNSTGNAGMATAGSGDVLTGILLGLLAQGYSLKEAAILGVYLHGLAGDIAVKSFSEESLIAGDIIDHLGKAFNELKLNKERNNIIN
ncbi:MAG: NAD(P)H-hydrate dehydratase [Bacteroidales bacterium]|nr:NAD(P)H-hydrate dehydratase [Bacteroidales bacterium]